MELHSLSIYFCLNVKRLIAHQLFHLDLKKSITLPLTKNLQSKFCRIHSIFWACSGYKVMSISQIYHKRTRLLKNLVPWLTHRCQEHILWTVWRFSAWIRPHTQEGICNMTACFFPLALQDICAWVCAEIYFSISVFFSFHFFSFTYLFVVVIDLPLNLLLFWESIIETGNFHHGVATCILLWVFQSNFWAFSYIFQAPLSWSLWYGYHWKDLQFSSCRTWV